MNYFDRKDTYYKVKDFFSWSYFQRLERRIGRKPIDYINNVKILKRYKLICVFYVKRNIVQTICIKQYIRTKYQLICTYNPYKVKVQAYRYNVKMKHIDYN